ncbi:MAG: sel1 repeat family protein [Kiritimatiellae bacterium]|nr:sel1 repeat family protein [Kiritimatiellia bacterium]
MRIRIFLNIVSISASCMVLNSCSEPVNRYELTKERAEKGNVFAQITMGVDSRDGQGVEQNYAEALRWFRMAASQGDPNAYFYIGSMYECGNGVKKNYSEALKMYLKAAEAKGFSLAQYIVGNYYLSGKGVLKDAEEGLKWHRKAAREGNEDTLDLVSHFHTEHHGGAPTNVIEAYAWANIVIMKRGHKTPYIQHERWRDSLAKKMTPQQKEEAHARLQELLPEK